MLKTQLVVAEMVETGLGGEARPQPLQLAGQRGRGRVAPGARGWQCPVGSPQAQESACGPRFPACVGSPRAGVKSTLCITRQLAGSKTERLAARGGDPRLHGRTPALFLARESSSVI